MREGSLLAIMLHSLGLEHVFSLKQWDFLTFSLCECSGQQKPTITRAGSMNNGLHSQNANTTQQSRILASVNRRPPFVHSDHSTDFLWKRAHYVCHENVSLDWTTQTCTAAQSAQLVPNGSSWRWMWHMIGHWWCLGKVVLNWNWL